MQVKVAELPLSTQPCSGLTGERKRPPLLLPSVVYFLPMPSSLLNLQQRGKKKQQIPVISPRLRPGAAGKQGEEPLVSVCCIALGAAYLLLLSPPAGHVVQIYQRSLLKTGASLPDVSHTHTHTCWVCEGVNLHIIYHMNSHRLLISRQEAG